MKRKFFIYSLPRSGSTWLSQFFSQPGCYCYHEPFADKVDLLARMESRPEPVVGAIDTSAHGRQEAPDLGECRYYVLRRDLEEIEKSLEQNGWTMNLHVESLKLDKIAHKKEAIGIYYERFGDIEYLKKLWSSVVGSSLDTERAIRLMEMNIQRDIDAFLGNRPHLQVNGSIHERRN